MHNKFLRANKCIPILLNSNEIDTSHGQYEHRTITRIKDILFFSYHLYNENGQMIQDRSAVQEDVQHQVIGSNLYFVNSSQTRSVLVKSVTVNVNCKYVYSPDVPVRQTV